IRRADGYWIWVGGPVPPGAAAITIGPVVSVRRRAASSERLLRHEEEHVRQWAERGVVGFLRRYMGDYLGLRLRGWPHWSAYRRIGFEVEAEWRARRPDLPPVD
ncbi:MAG TPA: hypothetical protein VK507_15955, partial [Iamia sp.]|nr:hypothetical protein [Iamia sp.]